MPYRTEISVTWGDTDAGGLIYFPQFFHYFVVGLNAYFKPIAPHLMEKLRKQGYVLPSVDAAASFESPLRAGDVAQIETTIEKVSTSSFTSVFEIIRAGDDVRAATGHVTFVLVDADFEPVPLTEEIRACIREREGKGC